MQPSSGGTGISGADDVWLNNPAADEVLTYNTNIQKWGNKQLPVASDGAAGSNGGFGLITDQQAGTLTLRTTKSLFRGITEPIAQNLSAAAIFIGDSTSQVTPDNPGITGGLARSIGLAYAAKYPTITVRSRTTDTNDADSATGKWRAPLVLQTGTGGIRYASFAGTNNTSSAQIYSNGVDLDSGDFSVRALIQPTSWTQGPATLTNTSGNGGGAIAALHRTSASTPSSRHHGWVFALSGGRIHLTHWNTPQDDPEATDITASAALPTTNSTFTAGGVAKAVWVKASLVCNDGNQNHIKTFYWSADGVAWTQIGSPQTIAGIALWTRTSTMYSIGSSSDGNYQWYVGGIYEVHIEKGIVTSNGPTVAPYLPDQFQLGTGVTLNGAPIFDIWNHSHSSMGTSGHVAVKDRYRGKGIGASVTFINLSHNDQSQRNAVALWENLNTLVGDAKAKNPGRTILLTQNPEISSGSYDYRSHEYRNRYMESLADDFGCDFIDVFSDWKQMISNGDLDFSVYDASTNPTGEMNDQVHPRVSAHDKSAAFIMKFDY